MRRGIRSEHRPGPLDFEVRDLRDDVVRVLQRHGELAEDKRSAYDLYLEGCRSMRTKRPSSVPRRCTGKALELDPGLANALTNLGNVRFRRGYPEEAEQHYRKALGIDADQPEAYYNLGFLYYERGDAVQQSPVSSARWRPTRRLPTLTSIWRWRWKTWASTSRPRSTGRSTCRSSPRGLGGSRP